MTQNKTSYYTRAVRTAHRAGFWWGFYVGGMTFSIATAALVSWWLA